MTHKYFDSRKTWYNRDDDSLYQTTITSPPPSKDFVQIYVSFDEVNIYNIVCMCGLGEGCFVEIKQAQQWSFLQGKISSINIFTCI